MSASPECVIIFKDDIIVVFDLVEHVETGLYSMYSFDLIWLLIVSVSIGGDAYSYLVYAIGSMINTTKLNYYKCALAI